MFSYCRLCAEQKKKTDLRKTVYDWAIKEKLVACCMWKPSSNEFQIPNTVCNDCVEQLENCWQFAMRINESEQKLLQIVHFSSNELEFREESEPPQEFIEIKPTEEPEDEQDGDDQDVDEQETTSTDSETDSEQSNHSRRSARKSRRKKKRKVTKLCSILRVLSKEDCNPDGTIGDDGLAKIDIYLSEIDTKTWTDCHFKCNDCDYNAKGYTKFHVHDQTAHSPFLMKRSFQCPFCDQGKNKVLHFLVKNIVIQHFNIFYLQIVCKRLQSLVVHISYRHLQHLSYW